MLVMNNKVVQNNLLFETGSMTIIYRPMKDYLCKYLQGLKINDYDVSHAYDVVLEKLMGETLGEDINVNDSNIYNFFNLLGLKFLSH